MDDEIKTGSQTRQTINHKPQTKKFTGPVWTVVAVVAIFLLSQVIAAALAGILFGISSSNAVAALSESPFEQFIYILIAEGLAVWLVVKLLKIQKLKLAAIGLGRRPKWSDLSKALIGFGIFYGLLILVGILMQIIFPELNSNQAQDVGFNNLSTSLDYTLAFIALVVFPPIGEEVLVRGYLYSALRSKWRILPAVILTSLIFGFAHLQTGSGAALLWTAGIDTFILSLVLCYLRERTGALYAGILIHSMNNAIAFMVHFHH